MYSLHFSHSSLPFVSLEHVMAQISSCFVDAQRVVRDEIFLRTAATAFIENNCEEEYDLLEFSFDYIKKGALAQHLPYHLVCFCLALRLHQGQWYSQLHEARCQ